MRSRALVVLALIAVMVSGGVAYAQQDSPWLHIRVTEEGEDGAKVAVNLPISLVQVFADIAENMGALGIRVEKPSDLPGALDQAFSANRPVVLDVTTDIDALAPLAVT